MDNAAFGKRLNAARKERRITYEQLSSLCDLNSSVFVRQIGCASRLPSLPVFVTLCNKLGVSPNYLLADSLNLDEDDKLRQIEERLRELSPRQFEAVYETINFVINQISYMLDETKK